MYPSKITVVGVSSNVKTIKRPMAFPKLLAADHNDVKNVGEGIRVLGPKGGTCAMRSDVCCGQGVCGQHRK